jgi:hypothetical protein
MDFVLVIAVGMVLLYVGCVGQQSARVLAFSVSVTPLSLLGATYGCDGITDVIGLVLGGAAAWVLTGVPIHIRRLGPKATTASATDISLDQDAAYCSFQTPLGDTTAGMICGGRWRYSLMTGRIQGKAEEAAPSRSDSHWATPRHEHRSDCGDPPSPRRCLDPRPGGEDEARLANPVYAAKKDAEAAKAEIGRRNSRSGC